MLQTCSSLLRRSRSEVLLYGRVRGVSSTYRHGRTHGPVHALNRAVYRAAWRFARTQGRGRLRKSQQRYHIFGPPELMLTFGLFAAIAT